MLLSLSKRREPADRSRLIAAFEARDKAQQAVIEKQATFDRMQSVVRAADDAALTASRSAQRVTEARADWVKGGCTYYGTREIQALEETAADAARAAERAAADAKAVSKELRRLQSELESKHVEVRGAEDKITAAAAMIVAEEHSTDFAELEQDAKRFLARYEKVMGVRLGIERPWSLESKSSMDPAHEAISIVEAVINRAAIPSWNKHVDNRRDPQEFIDALTAPVRARIAALRGDPNS